MTTTWKIIIALLLLAGAVAGWNTYTHSLIAKGDKAGYARAQGEYRENENKALKEALADRARLEKELKRTTDEARTQKAAALAAADANAAVGQRLRDQLAASRRAQPCRSTAVAWGSAPADTAGDLLADVQRRLDAAADGIARFADESRIAGSTCEAAYQSLMKP